MCPRSVGISDIGSAEHPTRFSGVAAKKVKISLSFFEICDILRVIANNDSMKKCLRKSRCFDPPSSIWDMMKNEAERKLCVVTLRLAFPLCPDNFQAKALKSCEF